MNARLVRPRPVETVQILFWRLAAAAAAAVARRRLLIARVAPHWPVLLGGAAALAAGRFIGLLMR